MRRERIRVYTEASGPLYFGRIDPRGPRPALHRPPRRRRRAQQACSSATGARPPPSRSTPRPPHDPRGLALRRRLDIEDRARPRLRRRGARPATDSDHLTEAIVEDITRRRVGEMRQIIATITPEQYGMIREDPTPRARHPGRPGHGQDGGRPAPRRVAALREPRARARGRADRRAQPHVHPLHRPGAPVARRAERRAARDRRARSRAPHREISESRELATLKGSGRMAALLERLLWSRSRARGRRDRPARARPGASSAPTRSWRSRPRARERTRSLPGRARCASASALADQLAAQRRPPDGPRRADVRRGHPQRRASDARSTRSSPTAVWPRVDAGAAVRRPVQEPPAAAATSAGDLLSDEEIALLLSVEPPAGRLEMTPTDVALFDEARWLDRPRDADVRARRHRRGAEPHADGAADGRPARAPAVPDHPRRHRPAHDRGRRLSSWGDVLRDAGVERFAIASSSSATACPTTSCASPPPSPDGGRASPRGVRDAPWPPVAVAHRRRRRSAPAVAALAARMAADVGSVGVVVPPRPPRRDPRRARRPVDHADATRGAVGPGVNLLDLHVVKGLEFDAVVVVEPAAILDERPDGGRGGLYTALSRSTRALAIVHADALPDALATDPASSRSRAGRPGALGRDAPHAGRPRRLTPPGALTGARPPRAACRSRTARPRGRRGSGSRRSRPLRASRAAPSPCRRGSRTSATRARRELSISVWVVCATPETGSNVRCSSSSRPSPSSCQSCSREVPHEPVAVHGLDDEPPARAQHAADLRQGARVLLVAEVAERGEQVQRGVEALVGRAAARGSRRARTSATRSGPARRCASSSSACARSTPVTRKPARASGSAWRPNPHGTSSRSPPGGQPASRAAASACASASRVALGLAVGAQVELAEELVPRLGRARARAAPRRASLGGHARGARPARPAAAVPGGSARAAAGACAEADDLDRDAV